MSAELFRRLRLCGELFAKVENDQTLRGVMLQRQAEYAGWDKNDGALVSAAQEYDFAVEWVRTGENVYSLSHNLAALFALTTAPEIDWKHLPHAALVVQVPRVFLPLPGTLEPTSSYIYAFRGTLLVVSDWDTTAVAKVTNADVPGSSNHAERLTPARATKFAAAKLAAGIDRALAHREALATVRRDVRLGKLPTQEQERAADAIVAGMVDRFEAQARDEAAITASSIATIVLAMRFLSNTLAYIAESPDSVVLASPVPHRKPRVANLLPPRDVVVDRDFRDAAKLAVAAAMNGSLAGVRRVMKHHVRGHWRNQAAGPLRSLRRRTWIHPHVRGSQDLGVVVRRIETLKVRAS